MAILKKRKIFVGGFTVVELLVVVAIIAMLAGLITSAAFYARGRSLKSQTQAMIASIETALSMYSVDFAAYPSDSGNLYDYIGKELTVGTNKYGPYIKLKSENLSATGIRDPWSNNYSYDLAPASGNTSSYNLWSNGPDGVSGNADDIKNW